MPVYLILVFNFKYIKVLPIIRVTFRLCHFLKNVNYCPYLNKTTERMASVENEQAEKLQVG